VLRKLQEASDDQTNIINTASWASRVRTPNLIDDTIVFDLIAVETSDDLR
jgi:hypothetical protein